MGSPEKFDFGCIILNNMELKSGLQADGDWPIFTQESMESVFDGTSELVDPEKPTIKTVVVPQTDDIAEKHWSLKNIFGFPF